MGKMGPVRFGGPPSPRNIKCTRMQHFEKKNSKIFSPEGPHENVWGPTRMFPRARCGCRRACMEEK